MALLEATVLPALERHYLRLLAHGLRTFQAVGLSAGDSGDLPDRSRIEAWAARQPAMDNDLAFQEVFLEQLSRLLDPLRTIAAPLGIPPLELRMEHLVDWATAQEIGRAHV